MEGGHIGRMKRIKAFQAKNAQAAGNTGNTGNTTKNWNTTSMTDDEVGTRNPKLKTALQTQAKRPDWGGKPKPGKKTYKGDVSYSDVKKNKKGADYRASHGVGDETALGLKPPSAFETAKTATKKKRKKNTKRAARKRFREAVVKKNETPGRTKKTIEGIKEFAGNVADKLPGGKKRKKKKKQKATLEKRSEAMGGIPKIQM
jgi:hypothetical protein